MMQNFKNKTLFSREEAVIVDQKKTCKQARQRFKAFPNIRDVNHYAKKDRINHLPDE